MVSWSRKTRSLAVAGGAVLGGATLFAGGGLLGSSLAGADDDQPSNTTTVYVPVAGGGASASTNGAPAADVPAKPPRMGADTAAGENGGGFSGAADARTMPGYYGSCPAVLDGVVADGAINPASQGFVMNLLGAGYELQNISLRAEVPCDEPGAEPRLVLDTSWLRTADQRSVWVSQRESAEPTGNVLNQGYAEFWSDGYTYSVSSGYIYYAADGGVAEQPAARDAIAPPADDGQAQAVLLEIIGQLAPSLEEQCFFRPVEGDWSALAAVGIGDPRGAIPAGFAEDSVWATIFEPPAEGCDVARDVELPISFGASWADGAGGWISINVYQAGAYYGEPGVQVGYANDWSVNWSDESFQYSVYGNQGESGLGAATLTAIARAMDGGFDNACLMVDRSLSDAELAAAGINAPAAPEGYSLDTRRGTASEPNANCGGDAPEAMYSADWQFSDANGNAISASAWLDGNTRGVDQGDWYGWIGEGYINWLADNGVQYSISAWAKTGVPAIDRDALIAMAMSMDPGLDVDALSEETGGGYPRPLPVEDPATDAGGTASSGGSAEG